MKKPIRKPSRKTTSVVTGKAKTNQKVAPNTNNFLQQTIKNISDKITNIENKLKTKRRPSENLELQKELKLLKEQYSNELLKLQQENDTFKKEAEFRRLSEEKLNQDKKKETINGRIKTMIEKGAIASGEADGIKHWTSLFESNFDVTDKIVASQLEKLGSTQSQSSANNYTPTHQSIRYIGDRMASKYLSGDRTAFEPILTN